MSDTLHENDRYAVRIYQGRLVEDDYVQSAGGKYWDYYVVFNKQTRVVEYKATQLSEAIMVAEQLDVGMELRPWEQMRVQALGAPVNPDGSPRVQH